MYAEKALKVIYCLVHPHPFIAFVTRCIERCSQEDEGYAYAGVQYGRECFCGNDPPPADTIVDESECDWKCSGDHDLMCGALWRMNVYSTGEYCIERVLAV